VEITLAPHTSICYNTDIDNEEGHKMTLVVNYNSKKELKEAVGQRLRYTETSMFGPEYQSQGVITVAGRPHITGMKREFFAQVTMADGIIQKVT